MPDTSPVLIFTWGNPSRGDDAIGPLIHDLLQHENPENIDLLTDFQLQIEHATDLENREYVLFVDASASAREPYDFYRLEPSQDDTYTTHAMSPASLLEVYKKIYRKEPPSAFMLSIRGYAFDLGLPVSEKAYDNLVSAMKLIRTLLSNKKAPATWNPE
ncbi:MAG: hydrogenase maturation protease [Gammaproteobacteria bacterium]|jgi:hydrogenase maturation protease